MTYTGIDVVSSYPLMKVDGGFMSTKSMPDAKDFSAFQGMRVGTFTGVELNRHFVIPNNVDYELVEVLDIEQLANMLARDRLDYVFAQFYMFDTLPDSLKAKLKVQHGLPKIHLNRHLNCQNTPEGKDFIERFNRILETMKASGELKAIMGEVLF